jgi:anaerobic selenocysteine-containing dehydrogenase
MSQKHFITCPLCEATCGLVVETEGPSVTAIRGDEDDPLSRGYLCPKAVALQDLHDDPDRLRQPMRRTPTGDWEPIGWDQAFDEVAARIHAVRARHGRDALAFYLGNPTVHSLGAMTYGQLFMRTVRTKNRFSATSTDQLPHMLAALLMFGHQLALPVPDLDRTDFLLMLGANPLVSNGSLMTAPDIKRRLQDLRARGGQLVVVDPRRTETAVIADRHLFIRPGTDALLLLALIATIFEHGLAAPGRLAAFTDGLDALRAAARRFPPEEVADLIGIPAGEIRALARSFATAPTAVCYGRVGICTQEFGGLAAWLVNALNIITGNLDRPGGAMFTSPAIDLVAGAARLGQTGSFARYHTRDARLPEFGGELPVSALADEIERPGERQVRALFTSAGNPVLSTPNGARLERALERLELMVAVDLYINETTRHADIILPPTAPLEREHYDLVFNTVAVRNVAKWSPAVFERGPGQRHEWEIYLELTRRFLPDDWKGRLLRPIAGPLGRALGPRRAVDAMLRLGSRRLSVARLEQHPHGLDLGALEPRLPARLYTTNQRIRLAPAELVADLDRLARRAGDLRAGGQRLVLIGRRQLRSNNSWMHNSERLVKGKRRCTLLMHPEDAAQRGLAAGQQVRVRSRAGQVIAPLELSDELMPGVVSLPHGWGHARPGVKLRIASEHAGVSVNDLTDEGFVDALSGNAGFSGVAVEVETA